MLDCRGSTTDIHITIMQSDPRRKLCIGKGCNSYANKFVDFELSETELFRIGVCDTCSLKFGKYLQGAG